MNLMNIDGTKFGPGISAYHQQKNKRRNNLSSVISNNSGVMPLQGPNMPLTPPNAATNNLPGNNNSLFLPPMSH